MITDRRSCPMCGCQFFSDRLNQTYCRNCRPSSKLFVCERCDRETVQALVMVNGELVCGPCAAREPDPSPEEIAAKCAEIRRGWTNAEWRAATAGKRD